MKKLTLRWSIHKQNDFPEEGLCFQVSIPGSALEYIDPDTTDVSRPHAYLVWMLYDNDMRLLPEGSGVKRVTDPNSLKVLFEDEIPVVENGYLHV